MRRPECNARRLGTALWFLVLTCAAPAWAEVKVAAAADLAKAFTEVGKAFEASTGQKVTFVFGSTGLLAKQVEQGAPFDVFAAADTSFSDEAVKSGACAADSKSLYARGRIVIWTRHGKAPRTVKTLADLTDPRFVKVAIANPDHAPYGRAAMQAMEKANLVSQLKPRLVYGENVLQTLQFAQSGNAEAAIVALSLAVTSDGDYALIDPGLHHPIDQALVVCGKDPVKTKAARAFTAFVASPEGRRIMRRFGFLLPGEDPLAKQ